ncbi:unnamed protein product [Lactuca virosa]|uniref:Uncharacterized protein n=1 Tax=Lactuca virosa TaxID=75947 RepID=A0AAU9PC60_9ASTR|nr:unnamed protein product [Lactuca virosa]
MREAVSVIVAWAVNESLFRLTTPPPFLAADTPSRRGYCRSKTELSPDVLRRRRSSRLSLFVGYFSVVTAAKMVAVADEDRSVDAYSLLPYRFSNLPSSLLSTQSTPLLLRSATIPRLPPPATPTPVTTPIPPPTSFCALAFLNNCDSKFRTSEVFRNLPSSYLFYPTLRQHSATNRSPSPPASPALPSSSVKLFVSSHQAVIPS